jgi:hypothetical protein
MIQSRRKLLHLIAPDAPDGPWRGGIGGEIAAGLDDTGAGFDGGSGLITTELTIDRSGALDVGLKRPDLCERAFVGRAS